MNYRARGQQILKKIELLAQYSDNPLKQVRSLGLKAQKSISEHLAEMMRAAGLEVYTDTLGNLRARLTSYNPDAQYLIIGGHTDTVKNAGKFDGIFNVLMALEIIDKLLKDNRSLPFHVEIVAFVDGAQAYFDLPYLGCRYLIGQFDPTWLDRRNKHAQVLRNLLQNLNENKLVSQVRRPENCLAYLQFTLSDSELLDQKLIPIGISQGICGNLKFKVTFSKTSYNHKLYATAAASVVVYAFSNALRRIEYYTRQRKDLIQSSINNIGYHQASQGSLIDSISFEVNIFGLDDKILSIACETLKNQVSKLAKNYEVNFSFDLLADSKAVKTSPKFNQILANSIVQTGYEIEEVKSFEPQPLSFLASVIPSCMLVLRSEKGIYRQRDEYVRLEDIMIGLKVGEKFLQKLAEELS